MYRDSEAFKESLDRHYKWQFDYFTTIKNKKVEKAKWWRKRGEIEKCEILLKEAAEMKFQFSKAEAVLNYGKCSRFGKAVSFIPNILQIETQNCFKHRRDI